MPCPEHRQVRAEIDPFVPSLRIGEHKMTSVPMERLEDYDAVMVLTDHSSIDYGKMVAQAQLVLDTRNATRSVRNLAKSPIVSL